MYIIESHKKEKSLLRSFCSEFFVFSIKGATSSAISIKDLDEVTSISDSVGDAESDTFLLE